MRIHNLALPPVSPHPSSTSMIKLARLGVVKNVFCPQTFTWSALAIAQRIHEKKRKATYKAIVDWQRYINDNRIYERWVEVPDLD